MSSAASLFGADVAAFDLLPDPVFGWDAERRIVFWNRACEDLYGFTRAEATGRRPAELLSTSFPIPMAEVIETLADTGRFDGELRQQTKDGREVIVETRWLAVYDDDANFAGGVSIDREVTLRAAAQGDGGSEASAERERLQGRLHSAHRLETVGALAGGIAHDFNNMLAIIINYAALTVGELGSLKRTQPDPRWDSMIDDLGEVQSAAERAARLTHQLLHFSRQDVANPTHLDLSESVRGVEELLRRTLGEHIRLEISLAEDLRPVLADPAQIDHALVNLAVNSRDAMAEGGTLAIDTANFEVDADYAAPRPELIPGNYVRLRVSDTGVGMTPDVLARAFDPFFTTKPVGEGTGLGLAMVFGIVRQARGRAQFYSEPGIGTTFVALFPAAEQADSAPAQATTRGGGVHSILLVEDEEPLREVTRRILDAAGYEVLVAGDGASALELMRDAARPIDLLLTDVVMPGMLGHHLAAAARELQPSLRVLFMSGFAGPVLGSAISVGELIEKPFTAPHLLERITTLATDQPRP